MSLGDMSGRQHTFPQTSKGCLLSPLRKTSIATSHFPEPPDQEEVKNPTSQRPTAKQPGCPQKECMETRMVRAPLPTMLNCGSHAYLLPVFQRLIDTDFLT
jgi:hypothetical protein